ncbi:DNA binding protein [Pseudomonas fluorescens]|uniref:histone-like nucleoid-structuring protein, MvaT/MvaU family n=1 Tax=Pseudomonas TaxID=286 RepID=UPI000F044930|nr:MULTISPECIES: histone-like nucleoid-structuring protein, MvaT/MvaU family [Pseudomonas]MBD8089359.1 DNA binding protein [Pseudomonas fluorescens]MBD8615214.1 DNA binding protein [Pseudomonas putida]MBD8682132.1 DNA binding protein [Pseudomonas sp. CFBP 13719]
MSKILQFKALEKKIAEDTAVFESLRAELEVVGRIGEYVRNEAAKANVDPFEVCLYIFPDFEKRLKKLDSSAPATQKITRQRKLKRYDNPHTNESIETKGGNHKTLKDWRAKWPNEVESWVTIIE